jgi:hypothetical protein
MYVVWHKRLIGHRGRPQAFLKDRPAEPLVCAHRGPGRESWIPRVIVAYRTPGRRGARQKIAARLPAIRSCCAREPAARAAWWGAVDSILGAWRAAGATPKGDAFPPRAERAIRKALRAVVPPPPKQKVAGDGRRVMGKDSSPAPLGPPAVPPAAGPFEVLGLDPATASLADVKRRWRELALQVHLRGGPVAEFVRVARAAEEAVVILSANIAWA